MVVIAKVCRREHNLLASQKEHLNALLGRGAQPAFRVMPAPEAPVVLEQYGQRATLLQNVLQVPW